MKKIHVYLAFVALFLLSRCNEHEILTPISDKNAAQQAPGSIEDVPETTWFESSDSVSTATDAEDTIFSVHNTGRVAASTTFYVSTSGSDSNDGSSARPWRTLRFAVTRVPANLNNTIQLSAGTFTESGQISVPPGVNINGTARSMTTVRAASSFYYAPTSPGYSPHKYLFYLSSSVSTSGNQKLSNFTIEGDSKQLHGGIYVYNRNNITLDVLKVQNTNFNGIWLLNVNNSKLHNTDLINCAWGSTSYCSGGLNIGNLTGVDINNLNVNEGRGYGVKAIGPNGINTISNVVLHDSRISVTPVGIWNGGSAPNIAIELTGADLIRNQIYNTYVDNTISLVNNNRSSTGVQTIRIHHNTIDMETRAKGAGYGIELTIHDAEIDHNFFLKGTNGIANWDSAMKNWNIHHNTFYALGGQYPGEILRAQKSGLHSVKLHNNTIEFAGSKTMNVVGMYGGSSDNVTIQNNLFINNNSSYSYYPNSLIRTENGATLSGLTVKHNVFNKLPVGSVSGGVYQNNTTADPLIAKTGSRPSAYYKPLSGSSIVNSGIYVGLTYLGTGPDRGANEQ